MTKEKNLPGLNGANVKLIEEGRVIISDRDDPDGIDILETIRDLTRRIEDLEHGK